jgi:hypothetical protein
MSDVLSDWLERCAFERKSFDMTDRILIASIGGCLRSDLASGGSDDGGCDGWLIRENKYQKKKQLDGCRISAHCVRGRVSYNKRLLFISSAVSLKRILCILTI